MICLITWRASAALSYESPEGVREWRGFWGRNTGAEDRRRTAEPGELGERDLSREGARRRSCEEAREGEAFEAVGTKCIVPRVYQWQFESNTSIASKHHWWMKTNACLENLVKDYFLVWIKRIISVCMCLSE